VRRVDKEKLFIALLGLTVVLAVAFGVGLTYDLATYHSPETAATSFNQLPSSGDNGGSNGGGGETSGIAQPGAGGPASGVAGGAGGGASRSGGTRLSGTAAVSGANNITVAAGDTILIGALITQSGPGNVSDGYHAMQAYVQWVNSQGGINGHRLALDVKDDGGNPSVGRAAFQQIVQEDHAFAIVAECAPLTDAVIVDDIAQDQIPVVNDCLTSARGYTSPWLWFNFIKPDIEQVEAAHYFLKNQNLTGIHEPYVVCLDEGVVLPYCDGFVSAYKAAGGTTCWRSGCNSGGYDKFEIGTTRAQYETVALQIKQSGADSIVSFLEPTNQLAFLQALQDQGMSPSRPHSQGGYPQYAAIGMDQFVTQTIGQFAYGTVVQSPTYYLDETQYPGVALMHQVVNRFQPDTPVDSYVQAEWNPTVIFGEALRRMGQTVSRANLINVLNSMGNYSDGQQLALGWTPTNHAGPDFTRYARLTGPSQYNLISGWIDANGNPAG